VSDRERSRTLLIKRTLYASGALFAALFVLLSAQMVLGRDPALGARATRATQTAQVRGGGAHERSIVDRLLSLAGSALSGGDHGGGASSGQSQSSQSAPAPAPAPVQSATS
jgi:hypothetical protein